jgi:hypothetical protein
MKDSKPEYIVRLVDSMSNGFERENGGRPGNKIG